METRTYRTGEFARRARVSVRTLRFYDREGLLRPAEHSLSGHRLYSDADLVVLSRILGLKLMGFTLAEIRAFLKAEPEAIGDALGRQRSMLEERQRQLAKAVRTIGEVEAKVREGAWDWDSILRVVEVMHMNEDRSWAQKHLSQAQIDAVAAIKDRAYSPEAEAKLAARSWTEEDQVRVNRQWEEVYAEAARLSEAGADPAGPEGQALAATYHSLIQAFTMGDPELEAGLANFYQEAKDLPPEQSPYPQVPAAVREFAERAYESFLAKNR